MFVDFSESHDWSGYDFVIIGAGVAGLFLAQKFAPIGRVLVLEAGNKDPSTLGDGYYDIEVTGRRYDSLGQRLSCFGGTSNHWGGHSHPLGAHIFSNRPGFPGWPISYADYAFHLPEAQAWLNLISFDDLPPGKTSLETGLLAGQQNLSAIQFQFSNPILRLGDQPTIDKFTSLANVDVVVDTRVTDIALDDGGDRVTSLAIRHMPSGKTGTVPAKTLILSAGGIENPRLMLWAARKYRKGNPLAGGPNELSGKYFMEHPSISPVDIYFDARADLSGLAPQPRGKGVGNVVLRPSDEFLLQHGLGRFGMHFQEVPEVEPTVQQLGAGKDYFVAQSPAYTRIWPFFIFEQTPDRSSYVGLSDKIGTDGTPLARLNWTIRAQDVENYRKSVLLMCGLLNQYGFAKSRLLEGFDSEDWSAVDIGNASHQMGTTRMAHDRSAGVVDENSKVFGLDNMYIAGASVFPSTDFVNPTMNLMALTARLANFIISKTRDIGANYRLGIGQDDNSILKTGWSKPEGGGVWTDGAKAVFRVAPNRATKLNLVGRAYREANVTLAINGAMAFSGPAKTLMQTPVPMVATTDPIDVELEFTGLTSPAASGESDDARALGIFVQKVVLQ